mmetsp:Transcript_31911/g.58454  ORF Transcript_31911/g.58454 Transcript_31911/m.58454 type:complete len:842 (-) Transcript_31911:117-2642(-)
MGFLEVGYPGFDEVPTNNPVLCSVPSYVSMLQDLTQSLRASHAASCNRDVCGPDHSADWVQRISTVPQARRCLGMETGALARAASLTSVRDSADEEDQHLRPRAASQEPTRPQRQQVNGAKVRSESRPRQPLFGDAAAALKSKVQEPADNVKAILAERLSLLSLACAGGGAARYGLSTTISNAAIRTTCEASFRNGRLLVTLAELVDAVVGAGLVSLPEAVAIVRDEWWGGGLRLYDGAECLLQPHLISRATTQEELAEVVKALHTAQASPTCAHLSWPLLQSILVCFQRERLRSTFDLILETCSSAFGLKCSVWDIITAVALSPREACVLEVAPWPVPYNEQMEMEQNMLAWGMLTLNNMEGSTTPEVAEPGKVFPQFSKCLEKVVENEFNFAELHGTIQLCIKQTQAHAETLTVPVLLARAALRAPHFDGLVSASSIVPCGAFLWIVEKVLKGEPDYSRRPSFNAREARGALEGTGACSSGDLVSSSQPSNPGAASGSLGSLSAVGTNATGDESGSDYDNESEPDEEEEGNSTTTGMTPIEAFISCFYEDLVQHHPLYLSNVNNLYRMRSGGRGINYQKHGYSRMAEFLAEVPGVELTGTGNQMEVKMCNSKELTACAQQVMKGLNARIQKAQQEGLDTSQLQLVFAQPKAVPPRILEKIWKFFQNIKDHEVPVNSFLAVFKQMYPNDKLHFRALGYPDFRGLMAQVRFVEKVGGRRHAKYKLKEGAQPPKRSNPRSTRAPEAHVSWSQPSSPTAGASPNLLGQQQVPAHVPKASKAHPSPHRQRRQASQYSSGATTASSYNSNRSMDRNQQTPPHHTGQSGQLSALQLSSLLDTAETA